MITSLCQLARFPPSWSTEVTPNCFIVRDANGQALSYIQRSCLANLTSSEGDPLQSFWLFRIRKTGRR
jgi:hypothetical protein